QLAADIFGMDVYIAETKEGAAVGGAVLAMQATGVSGVEPGGLKLVKKPRSDITDVYSDIVDTYRLCEQKVVDKFTHKS
ncbi:hypothetical protein EXIGLDRAFT_781378, partial [Exidia glandulosa HHB12029]